MSSFRTTISSKSVKFHRAVAGPAVAIVTVVAGFAGAWSASAAGQPAAIARLAGPVRPLPEIGSAPGPSSAPSAHGQQARLDAFAATASEQAGNALVISAGRVGRRLSPAKAARRIAIRLLHRFHWGRRQFRYLEPLWARESSWNVHAENLYSGAYGIPQAVPGSKMASAGPRWRSCARTQIRWGMRYIKARYGSPAAAWAHEMATGWY